MKILLHGASGVMGKNVQEVASEHPDCSIVAGVDRGIHAEESSAFPVYSDIQKVKEDFDVIIDFSVKEAVDSLLAFAVEKKKALVLCTTGLSETQLEKIEEAGRTIPILQSGNMSLGINVLEELLRIAAGKLYQEGFDVEIVEAHHRRKKDAPSGTALMLEKAVEESIGQALEKVFQREGQNRPREKDEIGMSSVRGGTIPGVHEVLFAGEDEVIKLEHTAYSRKIFAKGALSAAFFLLKQKPGRYTMGDVLRK